MKQKECLTMLMEKIKNNENVRVDLKNGVILELQHDKEIGKYRGYWKEENMYIGIWEKKPLVQALNGETDEYEVIL